MSNPTFPDATTVIDETVHRTRRTPNCIYIGTSKAGSTWIFDLLARHPDIFIPPGKGTYFFDSQYDRGLDWYLDHFAPARNETVRAEISHSYLYSTDAVARIASDCPNVRLLACLREPAERAFSDYLDYVKNGRFVGSFDEACQQIPSIVDRGRYATHLRPYVERFGRERIHISVFDELATAPNDFASKLFQFLGVEHQPLPDGMKKKMMPAGRPRSQSLMRVTKTASKQLKRMGLKQITGRVKRSRTIRNLLYRAYSPAEKPVMPPSSAAALRAIYAAEVSDLEMLLGMEFQQRWHYL